jgi:hypothetical protein
MVKSYRMTMVIHTGTRKTYSRLLKRNIAGDIICADRATKAILV